MVHHKGNEPGPPAWQDSTTEPTRTIRCSAKKPTTKTIMWLQTKMIPLTGEKHNLYHCKLSSSFWMWTWRGMFSPWTRTLSFNCLKIFFICLKKCFSVVWNILLNLKTALQAGASTPAQSAGGTLETLSRLLMQVRVGLAVAWPRQPPGLLWPGRQAPRLGMNQEVIL